MKITKMKGYIEIESPHLVRFFGRLVTGKNDTSAGALFPFIFVRDAEFTPDWLINHELIHFRQEIETLFIGSFIISLIERIYAHLFLRLNKADRYLFTAMEQEAYINMHNPNYLKERKSFSLFKYIHTKKRFKIIAPGQIEFTQSNTPNKDI